MTNQKQEQKNEYTFEDLEKREHTSGMKVSCGICGTVFVPKYVHIRPFLDVEEEECTEELVKCPVCMSVSRIT